MLRAQQRAADAYLPLSGALKARNTRDALESTAVQLITPNLPKRPTTKPRTSAGKISKTIFTAKLIGLSHFEPPWHLRVTQSFLTVAINLVGRTKESKWRALNRPVGKCPTWTN
jgi:hypothetical protein